MFKNRGLVSQLCKFVAVGIFSVCIDYGLMVLLVETSEVDYFLACAFSYTVSILVNYLLSMRFVFRGKENMSKGKEATLYFILALVGLGLNQAIMWVAVDVLGIFYGIAKWVSTFMVTWYNFISRKKVLE